jgi:hypothetical protein
VELKNEARKVAVNSLREFVPRYLHWDPVTDVDRTAMQLPLKHKTRTRSEAPDIHVGFSLKPHEIYEIEIRFWVQETGRGHVPKNMRGVSLYTLISDKPITKQDDLHSHRLLTKHINIISFPPDQQGKTVYMACRWQNHGGKEGEWSPIHCIMVS